MDDKTKATMSNASTLKAKMVQIGITFSVETDVEALEIKTKISDAISTYAGVAMQFIINDRTPLTR